MAKLNIIDLIPILCHYGELQIWERVSISLPDGPWEDMISIPRGTAYYMTVGCIDTQSKETLPLSWRGGRGPPSKPRLVAFYDMQGEGRLVLPRSSTVPFYIDLRPKDGCTFAPFWWLYCGRRHLLTNRNILRYNILVYVNIHKKYYFKVCVRSCLVRSHVIGWCQSIQWRPSIKKHVKNWKK